MGQRETSNSSWDFLPLFLPFTTFLLQLISNTHTLISGRDHFTTSRYKVTTVNVVQK